MKILSNAVIAALLVCGATAASANGVVATVENAKGSNTAIALDLQSDGKIAGFSFRIEVPGVNEKAANVKGCLAEMPKGFSASCSVAKGAVYVIGAADTMGKTLPAGLVSLGTIHLARDASLAKSGEIRVLDAEFSDDAGNSVAGTAEIQ